MYLFLTFLMLFHCCISTLNASTPIDPPPPSGESKEFQEADRSLNTQYAQLQWVDKVTGRFKLIDAKVGKVISCGQLKINVAVCRQSAPFEPPESKSFMTIWEYPKNGLPRKLFSGWMFASSPVLSTLINHPRYNVWLVKCSHEKTKIKKKDSIVHK
ncbi:MAG: DUF2155 domain-containing protein [Alphaproteobacteria bacterium]|nr:DUF2155 domain-containing protein [Alphaproteobacteria bacterium]